MRLSDIMSAADLAVYAEIGLVIFMVAFAGVVAHVLFSKHPSYEEAVKIPLQEQPFPIHQHREPEDRS